MSSFTLWLTETEKQIDIVEECDDQMSVELGLMFKLTFTIKNVHMVDIL